MSILPTKDGLYRKSEIAQLDLDIPDNLIANDDQYQWNSYAKSISPIKLVSKFNEAADQFIALVKHEDDLLALPQSKKELIYSKWLALTQTFRKPCMYLLSFYRRHNRRCFPTLRKDKKNTIKSIEQSYYLS